MFTALLERYKQGNVRIEDIKAWISSASLSYAELLQEEYSDWLENPNIPELLSYAAIADFLKFEKDIHIEPETELGKYLVAIEGKIKEVRPIFHWTERRIKGHFVVCFLSFLLERTMEIELNKRGIIASPKNIRDALNAMQFNEIQCGNNKYFLRTQLSEV